MLFQYWCTDPESWVTINARDKPAEGCLSAVMGETDLKADVVMEMEADFASECYPRRHPYDVMARLTLIKEEEEVKLMRQDTAICDFAREVVRQELRVGMTEKQVAGIAELTLREAGSEFAWTFTGGKEITPLAAGGSHHLLRSVGRITLCAIPSRGFAIQGATVSLQVR